MGQAEIKFSTGEALDGTGLDVVLSDPIDGFTPEQFYEMTENFILNRKKEDWEVEFQSSKVEDGVFIVNSSYAVEGLGALLIGKLSGTITVKWVIKPDEGLIQLYTYPNDPDMNEISLQSIGNLKVHADPLRFEFWSDLKPLRSHGPMIKGMVEKGLKSAGIDVEVQMSMPSPLEEGKKSVITSPLPAEWTMEKLFELRKQQAKEDHGVDFQGGVLVEREGLFFSTFTTCGMSEDGKFILHSNFGADEGLQEVESVLYERLLDDNRLETWNLQCERREGGKTAQGVVEPLIKKIFKHAQGDKD